MIWTSKPPQVIDIQSSSEAPSKPIMIINRKRRVGSYTLIIIDKFSDDTTVIINQTWCFNINNLKIIAHLNLTTDLLRNASLFLYLINLDHYNFSKVNK